MTRDDLRVFQGLEIDFSSIGLEQQDSSPYFCTPVGAEYVGWIGCDGVHFVLLPGDERVFCVDPAMGEVGSYVLPVAEDFHTFLTYLLFCRDANPLSQIWWMEEKQFRDMLAENVSWEELAVLTQRLFLGGMPAAALSAAPEGLTMELQQCTTTGAVVVLQNAAEETFSYGADYGLYRQVNGGWYQMNKEMDTIAIAYELAPGESRKLTLSWGELDWGGVLPAGTYCVAQGGLLGEQQVTVSVTFAIK